PDDIETLESDAILAFRMEVDGGVETWSLLPQVFFVKGKGTITYVYNHTPDDIELLIDGNFDLSGLSPDFTDAQVFRFVVVPSDFSDPQSMGIKTLSDLEGYMDLKPVN